MNTSSFAKIFITGLLLGMVVVPHAIFAEGDGTLPSTPAPQGPIILNSGNNTLPSSNGTIQSPTAPSTRAASPSNSNSGCANSLSNVKDFKCFVTFFGNLINDAVRLLLGLAIVLFMFGLLKYIIAGGDEAKVKEARTYIVFGLIAMFVMFSVWGLVSLLTGVFFPDGTGLSGPQFKQ